MLLDDLFAAGRPQLDFLCLCRLLVRGDARIADQSALWSTGSAILRVSGHPERLKVRFDCGFSKYSRDCTTL